MPRANPIISTMTNGELSPLLDGRVDVQAYFNGAKTLENFLILPYGGVMRRPGTYYVGATKGNGIARLVPFQFSTTQAYILEFGEGYIRFYKDQGQIQFTTLTLDAAPTPADFAPGETLTGATSGKTCIVVSKTSSTVYICKHLTGAFTDGEVIQSGANSRDCAATWPRLTYVTPCEFSTITAANTVGFLAADLFDLQFAQSADTMWIVHPSYHPTKLTRTAHDDWTLTEYDPTATPFTGVNLYPSCVAIYEQRLIFANSNTYPQKIWTTKSGDYENMTTGTGDADAMSYTIGSQEVNAIRWLCPGKILLAGTLGGVFSISSGSASNPLTPTNVVVKLESSYGSVGVTPKKIGNFVYYIQRNQKIMREIGYSYEIDEYLANDVTVLSEHITSPGIIEIGYQQTPFNMLWCVRSDGVIATFTRQIDQKVLGWARQITDGEFESVAVIPGDGESDEVWFIVKRYINGAWVRYIEYLKPIDFGDEQEDAFFVDCGLTTDIPKLITGATTANPVEITTSAAHGYSNGDTVIIRGILGMTELNGKKFLVTDAAATTFTLRDTDGVAVDGLLYEDYISIAELDTTYNGEVRKCTTTGYDLTHLEDKTVSILGDGAVVADEVVVGNTVTIDTASGEIHIGLPYTSLLKTMRLEAGSVSGTAQGKIKRIGKAVVRLYKSLGCQMGTVTKQDIISFRNASDPTDIVTPLFSGDKTILMPSLYDSDSFIVIKQTDPLPLNILSIMPCVVTNEG